MSLLTSLLSFGSQLFLPGIAHAQSPTQIVLEGIVSLCSVIPCNGGTGGIAGLSGYIYTHIFTALRVFFIAVALVMLFINALNMVIHSSEESAVTEATTGFVNTIIGAAVVGLASLIVDAVAPNPSTLVHDPSAVASGIDDVVLFLKSGVAIMLLANIVLQSFRLIFSRGLEEKITRAKTRLIGSFIGVVLIMLANAIKAALAPGSNAGIISVEAVGIANYLLTFIGALAVFVVMIAGVLLVLSIEESLKDKAKIMIKTAIAAVVVVLVAFALVNTFLTIN